MKLKIFILIFGKVLFLGIYTTKSLSSLNGNSSIGAIMICWRRMVIFLMTCIQNLKFVLHTYDILLIAYSDIRTGGQMNRQINGRNYLFDIRVPKLVFRMEWVKISPVGFSIFCSFICYYYWNSIVERNQEINFMSLQVRHIDRAEVLYKNSELKTIV